jgi:hypothetical protein
MKLVVKRYEEQRRRFRLWRKRSDAFQRPTEAISAPGKAIEKDVIRFAGTVELWRSTPRPPGRKTPLGRRLDELRRRILESGEPPLSSWEEVDRELGERRSERDG